MANEPDNDAGEIEPTFQPDSVPGMTISQFMSRLCQRTALPFLDTTSCFSICFASSSPGRICLPVVVLTSV